MSQRAMSQRTPPLTIEVREPRATHRGGCAQAAIQEVRDNVDGFIRLGPNLRNGDDEWPSRTMRADCALAGSAAALSRKTHIGAERARISVKLNMRHHYLFVGPVTAGSHKAMHLRGIAAQSTKARHCRRSCMPMQSSLRCDRPQYAMHGALLSA